jgi:hypothetical protein
MKNQLRLAALAFAVVAGSAGYAAAQDYRYDDRDDNRYDQRDSRYGDRDDNRYDQRDNRYGDRDDNRYYDRDGYRYDNFRRGLHVARDIGFRDGAQVAREDMWRGKPFNPNPRGRYDDLDHGYRRQFGNKHEYREHYSQAYREGYMSTFRGDRYYR